MAGTDNATYTREQVAAANTPEKLWIILHGKVYNVSRYLDDHPGGRDVLMDVASTDTSGDFDFVGHSKSAIKSLQKFEIRTLGEYRATPKREAREPIVQLKVPLSSSSNKTLTAKVSISVFLLLPPALYYTASKNLNSFKNWSGRAGLGQILLVLFLSFTGLTSISIVIVRRFWNRMFYQKDVFEYPPHFTL